MAKHLAVKNADHVCRKRLDYDIREYILLNSKIRK
jgi:hypothetical protein